MSEGLESYISNFADEIKLEKTSKPFVIQWRCSVDCALGLTDSNCRYTETFKSSSKEPAEEIAIIWKGTGTIYLVKQIRLTV